MTSRPETVNAMTAPLISVRPKSAAMNAADVTPAAAWSRRVLPSIVITIGPLLLWLDHLVHIPRYRPVGWALIAGPVVLVATMSGSALAVTTGPARLRAKAR